MTDDDKPDAVDVFWSFRSPYSWLATKRLRRMAETGGATIRPRPVFPIAVRQPDFFRTVRPQWVPYLLTDIIRLAEFHGLEIGMLNPDPVIMDMQTGDVSPDQPHIGRLTRLGVLASEEGPLRGWAFLDAVSTCIWSGQAWTQGEVLAEAVAAEGFDLADLDARQREEATRLEAIISHNEAEHARHHWGVPLMVWRGEPFYGQDRIELLKWRLARDLEQDRT